jgi:hypothetical protein
MQSPGVPQTEADRNRAQVERILAGDEAALSEIYEAYRPRVRSFIRKRVRAEHEVEESIDAGRLIKRCDETLARNRHVARLEIFRLRYGNRRSIAENVGKSNEAVKISLRRSRRKRTEVVPELRFLLASAGLERPSHRLRKRSAEAPPALHCGAAR